jgi:hypothetical protein
MFLLNRKAALLLTLSTISAATTQLKAQGFYIKEGIGYAFPMPGSTKDQLGNILNGTRTNSQSQTTSSYQIKNASFSSGFHNITGAGYMFTKNIGVELSADILLGSKKYSFEDIGTTAGTMPANITFTRQSDVMINFMPALVLQTSGTKAKLYMRMGLALPINSGINRHDIYQFSGGGTQDDNWEVKNYFSVGFAAATGAKFKIGNNFDLWCEVSMLQLALSREESDLKGATINGQSYSAAQLTGTKTYYYNKDATTSANGIYEETFSQPYSNISIMVGITYNFSHEHLVKTKRMPLAKTRSH